MIRLFIPTTDTMASKLKEFDESLDTRFQQQKEVWKSHVPELDSFVGSKPPFMMGTRLYSVILAQGSTVPLFLKLDKWEAKHGRTCYTFKQGHKTGKAIKEGLEAIPNSSWNDFFQLIGVNWEVEGFHTSWKTPGTCIVPNTNQHMVYLDAKIKVPKSVELQEVTIGWARENGVQV